MTLDARTEALVARSTKHGFAKRGEKHSPTYRTWESMKDRCSRPNNNRYSSYGARGITVCERWRTDFLAFLADMGERPEGTTLDRIDNDGNYEPGNCRWATHAEQRGNRQDNVRVACGGVTRNLREWANIAGIKLGTLRKRLRSGWTTEQALSTPVTPANRVASRVTLRVTVTEDE